MPDFNPSAAAAAHSGVFGLPHTPEEAKVVLLPVPFEATTSYGGGTSRGPAAILSASRQVDLFDLETGKPYEQGISLLPEAASVRRWNKEAKRLAAPIIARGGELRNAKDRAALEQVNALSAKMNDWVYEQTVRWLDQGKIVGAVGGDHSSPFGTIRAYAERFPGMGILHLDAHADLRAAYEGFVWSHASIFHNVMTRLPSVGRLVQVGIRDLCDEEQEMIVDSRGRIVDFYDPELARRRFDGLPWARQVDQIVSHLPHDVYLSFDIDGLDPVLCPNTGTPVPGGLSFQEAVALVAGVVRSGRRIIGFDLCEVAPDPRGGDWDGNVGARLLYKMIGWTLRSTQAPPASKGRGKSAAPAPQRRASGRK
jgi:agmatinase